MASCPLPSGSHLIPSKSPIHAIGTPKKPSISTYNAGLRHLAGEDGNSVVSKSMSLYTELLQKNVCPDSYTFPALFKILARISAHAEGVAVHAHVIKLGFELNCYVRNNLIRFYAACRDVVGARILFDDFPDRDVVSWTILVSGYAKMGLFEEAVGVFLQMVDEDLEVDAVAAVAALSACSELGDLELGRKVHGCVAAKNVHLDVVAWNALVDMYAKCGDIASSYKHFKNMPEKNIVSWNSMISGFARAGEFRRALSLFREMQSLGMEPDGATFVGVLSSCANLGALDTGRWIHAYMVRSGHKADGVLGNALVDMYAKCGVIDRAMEVFAAMRCRDVYTYTSMILGFAMQGQAGKGLGLFAEMREVGLTPNEITFVGVLSTCCHSGLIDEGLRYFESMSEVYGMKPKIEHYGCVVDMLGRAGLLDEAEELIRTMLVRPDSYIWGSLLAACKIHGDVARGERAMQRILELEGEEAGDYILMSNMYTSAGRRSDSIRVRKAMRRNKIKKIPGCSLIEINGIVHAFHAKNKPNQ